MDREAKESSLQLICTLDDLPASEGLQIYLNAWLLKAIEYASVSGPIGHKSASMDVVIKSCPLLPVKNVETAPRLLRRVVGPAMLLTWTKMLQVLYRRSNSPSPSQVKAHDPVNFSKF